MISTSWTRRDLIRALAAVPLFACTRGGDAAPDAPGVTDADPDRDADAAPPEDAVCADLPIVDLVADCEATGDGMTNDTRAFQRAAELLVHGGTLVIPPGTYIVGKQDPKAQPTDPGAFYKPQPIFKLANVPCLVIRGNGATIKLDSGLHYGGFDEAGNPIDVDGRDQAKAAHIGRVFDLLECSNVVIENLEIDGNLGGHILGGQWGDVDRQTLATGLGFDRCDNVTVTDVHVHHHALDGITVLHTNTKPAGPKPHAFLRVNAELNGRQALSWISGWGLSCTDCKFNHTGRGTNGGAVLSSSPRAGLDIEPNPNTTDITRDGLFSNCEFANNAGPGMQTAGGDGGHAKFVDCTFWGTTSYTLYPMHPALEFENCKIHGTAVHAGDGTSFTGCTFEDVPWTDGRVYRNGSLYNLPEARTGVTWTDCTFINHGVRAVSISDPTTREVFDRCTFVFSGAGLANGSPQATLQGSMLTSCHFMEGGGVATGTKTYFIDVTNVLVGMPAQGDAATHVDGPHVKWNSVTGSTGDIAPATYA
jgi:hypothetical protein